MQSMKAMKDAPHWHPRFWVPIVLARMWSILAGLICFWLALMVPTSSARATTITISCGSTGVELELCRQGADAWAHETGNKVKLVSMPGADTLSLTQQLLAARAADIDIFQIDVAWTGILASQLYDLRAAAGDRLRMQFPALVKAATVGGRLVAMPWFGDVGVLYYRKDLLKKYGAAVPATWNDLKSVSERIQAAERAAGHEKFWGFVWQGRAYEGLTCDALEWISSYGGGTIVDPNGRVTIDNGRTLAALSQAASWVGDITPIGVLNYTEEDARGVFQSGDALFMRNWPYAWPLMNSAGSVVRNEFDVAALPGSAQGSSTGTLAGSMLVVNRYSNQAVVAANLVMYLTSEAEQKRRAIAASYAPTMPILYKDPEVLAAAPILGKLLDVFSHAVLRPSTATGDKYNRVSIEFSNAVHDVLSGEVDAAYSMGVLDGRLRRLARGGRW